MSLRGAALFLLLALGCGDRPAPPPAQVQAEVVPEPPAKPEPVAPKPEPPPPTPKVLQPSREDLRKRVAELESTIAELERARQEILARHELERVDLPVIDAKMRQRYMHYVADARTAEHKLALMEERFEEIEKIAKSVVTGKLKELRDQREAIEMRRDEIQNAWHRAIDDARVGRIEESPAKKDLYLVRAAKRRWFELSGPARRGRATGSQTRALNKGYRAWFEEVPARKEIVARVLAHPLGRKWKPDTYNFTSLDFYVFLELLENELDLQNVAVENKELKNNRARLEQIQAELDATEQQIGDHIVDAGSELSEYEDLLDRLPDARANASYLSTRVGEWAAIIAGVVEVRERQRREEDEVNEPLIRARRELQTVNFSLQRRR